MNCPRPVTTNSRWLQCWCKQLTDPKTSAVGDPPWGRNSPEGPQLWVTGGEADRNGSVLTLDTVPPISSPKELGRTGCYRRSKLREVEHRKWGGEVFDLSWTWGRQGPSLFLRVWFVVHIFLLTEYSNQQLENWFTWQQDTAKILQVDSVLLMRESITLYIPHY